MENIKERKQRTEFTPEMGEKLKELVESGISNKDIEKILNIGSTTVSRKIGELGIIRPDKNKDIIIKTLDLHSKGFTVQQICEIVGASPATIRNYLSKNNLETNTKRMKTDDVQIIEHIKKLVLEGKTNAEISKLLNISKTTSRKYTELSGLETNSTKAKNIVGKEISLSEIQLEILYGSLLGDMCLTDGWKNVRPAIAQGGNQEAYFDYKCSFFEGLLGKISKTPRYDKRTDKWYNKFSVRFLAHPIYTTIKKDLYPNNNKTVTLEWLNKITPRGLAFWFMDDGCNDGTIATNSFSLDEHKLIQTWFKDTYGIECTIHNASNNQHTIYIKMGSREKFEKLIFPYMIPSMYYKLKKLDPNSVNCLENL